MNRTQMEETTIGQNGLSACREKESEGERGEERGGEKEEKGERGWMREKNNKERGWVGRGGGGGDQEPNLQNLA